MRILLSERKNGRFSQTLLFEGITSNLCTYRQGRTEYRMIIIGGLRFIYDYARCTGHNPWSTIQWIRPVDTRSIDWEQTTISQLLNADQ